MNQPTEAMFADAGAPSQDAVERRRQSDRRTRPTDPWWGFPWGGRRMRNRRADEHREPYFVDRFSPWTFVVVLILLIASILDACLTIQLLRAGANEINPVMNYFLAYGVQAFLVAKYLLTAAGLPLLLFYRNHYLFGTRVRISCVIPIVVLLYFVLIGYQISLVQSYNVAV